MHRSSHLGRDRKYRLFIMLCSPLAAALALLAMSAVSSADPSASPTVNVHSVCFPTNQAGPLPNVPCWLADQLSNICVYGDASGAGDEGAPEQSSADQQACLCKAQGAMYFEYFAG
jgi:hypothetical protein